jgi:hypothetical protein
MIQDHGLEVNDVSDSGRRMKLLSNFVSVLRFFRGVAGHRRSSDQFKKCIYQFMTEDQQKADEAGDAGSDCHHLIRTAVKREQIEMHAISLLNFTGVSVLKATLKS